MSAGIARKREFRSNATMCKIETTYRAEHVSQILSGALRRLTGGLKGAFERWWTTDTTSRTQNSFFERVPHH